MSTAVIGAPEFKASDRHPVRCAFLGCARAPRPLGLCDGHYLQQRQGKVLVPLRTKRTQADDPREAFWARVDKTGECWEWQGAASDGYGDIWWEGRKDRAHRVSYALEVGEIGDGMYVDHRCRNRICVRPSHLREATPKQNNENVGPRGSSGYRGVRKDRRGTRWVASAKHNGVVHSVPGSFATAEEASRAAAALRAQLFTHSEEVA